MKALPHINLVSLTRSWAWEILEGYTGVNCLHVLYPRHHHTFHYLRTNVSYENFFAFSYMFLCFEWP
jgi:hypothetical protein